MAKKLELDVVAEGVENARQFNVLKEKDFDCYQDYYFSRPPPQAVFAETLGRPIHPGGDP
jgi:EAL domain-containing protein (putative c-di-GMP-specific phosphodiesterase class I)